MGYIEWASKDRVVSSVDDDKSGPNQPINLKQMAVIMANYAQKLDYDLPQTLKAVTFADKQSMDFMPARSMIYILPVLMPFC